MKELQGQREKIKEEMLARIRRTWNISAKKEQDRIDEKREELQAKIERQ